MPLDPSISLQAKAPTLAESFAPISSMLDLSSKSLALQKGRETYATDVEAAKALSRQQQISAQKSQLEYEQKQQTSPLEVRQQTAQTKSAEAALAIQKFGLDKDQQKTALEIMGGFNNDPRVKSANPEENVKAVMEMKDAMRNAGIPSEKVEVLTAPSMAIAAHQPQNFNQHLTNMIQAGMGATGQQALQTTQLTTAAGAPALFTSGTGTLKPANIGGQSQQPGGVTPEQMQQPQQPAVNPNLPAHSQQEPMRYPVRQAGDIRPMAPTESADMQQGQNYRQALVNRQSELPLAKRNIDETIKAAEKIEKEHMFTTGLAGAATRKIAGWMGDPTYIQLSKDLANVQIANIRAAGGSMDTVSGQHLQGIANGDETYPPDVLIQIAKREKSNITNLDMQATALEKFSRKFGDSNINSFKQTWAKNSADNRIFDAINIKDSDIPLAEKKKEFDKLFGGMSAKKLEELKQKRQNIEKMFQTGALQ